MSAASPRLTLRVVTPQGVALETGCDSVTLPLADDASGQGGGSIGIRYGHLPALLSLGAGTVCAAMDGKTRSRLSVERGFALVERDSVSVISDSAALEGVAGDGPEQAR